LTQLPKPIPDARLAPPIETVSRRSCADHSAPECRPRARPSAAAMT
jgi:hypothetical protein